MENIKNNTNNTNVNISEISLNVTRVVMWITNITIIVSFFVNAGEVSESLTKAWFFANIPYWILKIINSKEEEGTKEKNDNEEEKTDKEDTVDEDLFLSASIFAMLVITVIYFLLKGYSLFYFYDGVSIAISVVCILLLIGLLLVSVFFFMRYRCKVNPNLIEKLPKRMRKLMQKKEQNQ